jgi:hypothetical protein
MLWMIPTQITFVARPPLTRLCHLLAASLRSARRVRQVVRLDVHDRRAAGEVARLVRLTKIRVLDVRDGAHLRPVEFSATGGGDGAVGVRVKGLGLPFVVEPAFVVLAMRP